MRSAIEDARDVLRGLMTYAAGSGIRALSDIVLIVDTAACRRHRARALATIRDGQRIIALAWLPDRPLSLCERADLRGLLLHELAHHVAGLEHNHREPFRLALVALAKVFGSPLPTTCDENSNRIDHPRHYLFACSPPSWLAPVALPPRRLRQIRRAWGMAPAASMPAVAVKSAPRIPCTVPQAVALASIVTLCATVLA